MDSQSFMARKIWLVLNYLSFLNKILLNIDKLFIFDES